MGEIEVAALRGVDVDLLEGELVVLLGASGSASRSSQVSSSETASSNTRATASGMARASPRGVVGTLDAGSAVVTDRDFFQRPVSEYMSADLELGDVDTPLAMLAQTMHGRRISALPIVDAEGALIGVVSRSDLIRLGMFHGGRRWTSPALPLPDHRARDIMTRGPRTIAPTASLQEAGRIMNQDQIHHVFVADRGRARGVISTLDLAAAVRDARIEYPLSAIMTSPVVSIDVHTPIGAAIELLDRVRMTGLIVTEHGMPIGVFTQLDAIASRDLPRDTPVEITHDAAVICLPRETKLHRAAAHAAQLDVRRVVVCSEREAVGVIGGLDFARVASGSLS